MSVKRYAEHRGCAHSAVQKAIKDGRLKESLVLVGKHWKIQDVELADAEWARNTRGYTPSSPSPAQGTESGLTAARRQTELERARLVRLQADKVELEVAARRGELLEAAAVERELRDEYARLRGRLGSVPGQLRVHRPGVDGETIRLVERLIHQALTELADVSAA